MEERRPRERELVLSPNEYAYVLDTTKGHINCYVGPNKTSLAQTDELVMFNGLTKRFDRVAEMSQAVQLFATAPAGWYLVLKNPAKDGSEPSAGVASASPELLVGRKVVVQGPASFPLWPGQMARVIQGHRLRSNQFLLVRCYDEETARAAPAGDETWVQGEKRVIRGTEASFYVPPTGVEVVCDEQGRYVRDAVTLQRLEYCVLVGEDGRKSYVRGEAVVFPSPNQRFLAKQGRRRFRAIELSETTGIYLKVIAPYEEAAEETGEVRRYVEGEELFLTGKNKVYFPREEHAIIRYGDDELHHAVAIPAGEGRYLLDRRTGAVSLRRGPTMLLPDPRREVIVRRLLGDRECGLMYPGNDEVLAYNQALRAGGWPGAVVAEAPAKVAPVAASGESGAVDRFDRPAFKAPRTITLDTRLDGVVSIDVWSGYATQLKSRSGARRVIEGPATVLLDYDETVEALTLSSGTPKTGEALVETAFLQLHGNKVSDLVEVSTSDLVRAKVAVRYRVSFVGSEPERWFRVDNYVQLLCDHASSLLKAAARRRSIHELQGSLADVVRDTLLGPRAEAEERPGLSFEENAMRVYDVEVLGLEVLDDEVAGLLSSAQRAAVKRSVEVADREALLSGRRRIEEIERQLAAEKQRTMLEQLDLEEEREARSHALEEAAQARARSLLELERAREERDAELSAAIRRIKVEAEQGVHEAQMKRRGDLQSLQLARLKAEVDAAVAQAEAFSPQLVSALHRLGDETLLSALSENFSELAAVEGRGVLETARKFLDFVPSSMVPQLRSGLNGTPLEREEPDEA